MNKKFSFLLAMLMPLAFIACSSEDEPEQNQLSGEEMYNHLIDNICDSEGAIVFSVSSNDPTIRGVAVDSEDEAKDFCEVILGESWNGTKKTKILPDGYGSITVCSSDEEGVFNTINFSLKNIDPFTLKVARVDYLKNDDNFFQKTSSSQVRGYECRICKYYISTLYIKEGKMPHPCPKCGKDDWKSHVGPML